MPVLRQFVAALALALAYLTPEAAAAQGTPAANLAGSWTVTVVTDGGSGTPTVTLAQQGDSLSGIYSSGVFGDIPLKGMVSGDSFTLQGAGSMQGESFTLTISGKIKSADEVEGTVDYGGLTAGTFTGKRRPPG